MNKPLIITIAVNGALATKSDNPAVPYSAADIAAEIIRAAEAGASMAHVHTRAQDGAMTQHIPDYQEIIERVGERSDIVLELSLGSRGFTTEQALEPLALKPLIASFPMSARRDSEAGGTALEDTARRMLKNGTRPAFAINSSATKATVVDLIQRGLAGSIPVVSVGVDPNGHTNQLAASLNALVADLPDRTEWILAKSGKTGAAQYVLRALAIASGGHIRVGFEDMVSTYDDAGLAPGNAWYVDNMAALAAKMGRPIATPSDVRSMLEL
jgi:3-keto-5-aminohexanoate cleavage enzyme